MPVAAAGGGGVRDPVPPALRPWGRAAFLASCCVLAALFVLEAR